MDQTPQAGSVTESVTTLETIELNPHLKFTLEERNRVHHLLQLEQSNVISFNDLEYEVASKVQILGQIQMSKSEYAGDSGDV